MNRLRPVSPCLQPSRCLCVALTSGALALASVMLSFGCCPSPEADIREAVREIPLEKIECLPFGMVKYRLEEAPIRQRLSRHDPQKAVSVITQIYRESEDPLTKAKTLAAAKLLLDADTPAIVRGSVLELARVGLECDDIRVAFHALLLLWQASDGQPEDVQRVARRLEVIQNVDFKETPGTPPDRIVAQRLKEVILNRDFINRAYTALGRWRARDVILEQVFRPAPPKGDEEAYLVWAIRTRAAVNAWASTMPTEDIPRQVGDRLVELMRARPQMAETVAYIFMKAQAKTMVPAMKAKVFDAETELATKVFTGTAILVLEPQDPRLRQEFPSVLKEYFQTRGEAEENLTTVSVFLGGLIRETNDVALFDAFWEAFREADDDERADFLDCVITAAQNESLVLHALSLVPDEELSRLMACSERLRFCLRTGLLREDGEDPVLSILSLPTQGAPSRAETERRVGALLRNLDIEED